MGKSDIAVKKWLGKKERFADLFNGIVFQGKQVVTAEELEESAGEAAILIRDKDGKEKGVQRYRDIVMNWRKDVKLAILACEDQEKIHYAMPVRMLLYDGLAYTEQVRKVWGRSEGKEEKLAGEELLSRFKKGDHIYPVISLVFYYGEKEWDGSKELYGMFRLEDMGEDRKMVEKYVPNYKINLVCPGDMEDLTRFQSDLQMIFGMLQCRKRKEKLLEYMHKNEEYFRHTDLETYQAIRVFLNSEKQLKELTAENGKEEMDMCEALQELYEDGVRAGRSEGWSEGRDEGRSEGRSEGEERFANLTKVLMESGRMEELRRAVSEREYRERLFEELNL